MMVLIPNASYYYYATLSESVKKVSGVDSVKCKSLKLLLFSGLRVSLYQWVAQQ